MTSSSLWTKHGKHNLWCVKAEIQKLAKEHQLPVFMIGSLPDLPSSHAAVDCSQDNVSVASRILLKILATVEDNLW